MSKKTAQAVIEGKGDYLLSVKGNQAALETDIADYVQDPDLRKNMGTNVQKEKNRGRIETRTAFVTGDIGWIPDRQAWPGLCCVGSIHTEFEEKGKKTSEWHYYISSRKLSARDLLHPARMEWSVESMHGCWMSILVRTFAAPRIEIFRKTSISSENLPYPLSNHLKCELPLNAPFPTSCLTAFLSLTLLSLFGVKIDSRGD